MPPFGLGIFVAGLVGLFVVVGGIAWWFEPRRRARRTMAGVREKRLGEIGEGDRFRVRGVARLGQGRRTSPITGRTCIGYRVVVEEEVKGNEGNYWKPVVERTDCAPFELHAEGFAAQVDGPFLFGLERDEGNGDADAAPEILDALERCGVSRVDDFGRPRRFRFMEARLEEGDPILVLGRASLSVDPRGQRDSARGQPILRVLGGTKREPTVLADEMWPGEDLQPL
jgi:hypothetical protein